MNPSTKLTCTCAGTGGGQARAALAQAGQAMLEAPAQCFDTPFGRSTPTRRTTAANCSC